MRVRRSVYCQTPPVWSRHIWVSGKRAYPELYTPNYSVKAWTSVQYSGKQVAYPLCFDMEYFVYNRIIWNRPDQFNVLVEQSETLQTGGLACGYGILYDVSDLLFNYHFMEDPTRRRCRR